LNLNRGWGEGRIEFGILNYRKGMGKKKKGKRWNGKTAESPALILLSSKELEKKGKKGRTDRGHTFLRKKGCPSNPVVIPNLVSAGERRGGGRGPSTQTIRLFERRGKVKEPRRDTCSSIFFADGGKEEGKKERTFPFPATWGGKCLQYSRKEKKK